MGEEGNCNRADVPLQYGLPSYFPSRLSPLFYCAALGGSPEQYYPATIQYRLSVHTPAGLVLCVGGKCVQDGHFTEDCYSYLFLKKTFL